ncbi:MAG: thioredoxin domain-containing protein [Ignavibacteria bacterium]
MKPNKLINEKSPYLLQHAYNPVEWYPWGEEAFSLARELNKPIFLSIGYSTCYWCHVMERECFENETIARMLNEFFVNIKLDREERPDIDKIYMSAVQSMIGTGGWPLNIFLTPTLKPFYGSTYIPPKAKYGRAGFEDIITQIHELWESKRDEIISSSERIFAILQNRLLIKKSDELPDFKWLQKKLFDEATSLYDYEFGGFGRNMKFPRTVLLDFLLTYYHYYKDSDALDMVTFTLKKMSDGSIYDHLGGGFHRYSVDHMWRTPHFEKMLYDQALITTTLLDSYAITKKNFLLERATETINYVLTELLHQGGGFYSAQDAESVVSINKPDEKEEGYYYLWTFNNLRDLLDSKDADIFSYVYGITFEGNIVSDPHNVFKNKNVLYLANDIYDTARHFDKSPEEIELIIKKCRNILFQHRKNRPKPATDTKIITSWNALMISSLLKYSRISGDERALNAAINTIDFILNNLFDATNNKLFRRFADNEKKYDGLLDDYSFFIQALIDMYETTFKSKYLNYALTLINIAIGKFYDDQNQGGFYDAPYNSDDLILKTKETYDGAEPSGNSVMINNLFRLARFTSNDRYFKIAEDSLKYFYPLIEKTPSASPVLVNATFFLTHSPREIIFSGDIKSDFISESINYLNRKFLPNTIRIHLNSEIVSIVPYTKEYLDQPSGERVYVCENLRCNTPAENIIELKKQI